RAAGFVSFADRATLHSLAETSERVGLFLDRLVDLLGPTARLMAQEHLMTLREFPGDISPQQNDDCNCTRLLPWDLPYLLGLRRSSIHHEELADYFSLGACMEGISQLADCLFGLKLHVEPIMPGEVWHPDVIKVGIYSKSHLFGSELDQPIGLVYCDLLDRPDKPAQDCHYTIQGGRQLPDGQYQIPIITLQLTLSPPSGKPAVPLLSLGQVENLFHEWGHALHSMLACTRYQHVTGTRCSTDFAELPSTLFEQFALDPRVTREYVRHWSTGKAPTARDLETLKRIAVARGLGQSVELIQQSTYASLDQILHSGPPDLTMRPSRRWRSDMPTSSQLLADLMERAGLSDWLACSPQQIGAWPHRFAHLVGYGGRYYAYLMARAGALLVWRNCFADNPWSSTRGQLYADKLLRLGGEFHPSTMISGLLSTCSSAYEDVTERPLTPEQLVQGLVDQVEENERSASVLLNSLHSPGLHQPGRTPRWPV
ncbi:Mitochondrial intermediate peptidase, partial [Fasciola gigantica]